MIDVENLRFAYGADPRIVDGLTHRFAAGDVHALTGPSGSGKSTLLYLLGLLLRPDAGRISIDGVVASGRADSTQSLLRGKRMGFVFQDAVLDTSRSLVDNVAEGSAYTGLSRRLARSRARALLDDVGVLVPADRRPGQISGGQAQRVALCRALLHEPPIILADEPTGNLDPDSADLVLDRLSGHSRSGGCVIIATHDPRVLQRCGDILHVGAEAAESPGTGAGRPK